MSNKIVKIIKHLLYAIVSNVLYGFVVYYLYILLAGKSLLYVYFVNLALIIIFLAMDEAVLKMWESNKIVEVMKKEKDIKKATVTCKYILIPLFPLRPYCICFIL